MTQQPTHLPTQTGPVPDRLPIFGPPALLAGEDSAAYDNLLARVSGNLKPSDIFEEIWMREIVDLTWETLRWRRHRTALIEAAVPQVLEKILQPLASKSVSRLGSFSEKLRAAQEALNAGPKLASEWAARDPAAIKRVEELLASAGVTMDNVVAQAVTHELDKLERFNRLIASAEWRRNATLREVERRRASFAEKLRHEVGKIEDAEFQTIEAEPEAEIGGTRPSAAEASNSPDLLADTASANKNVTALTTTEGAA